MLSIAVTTAPRQIDTLALTLESLHTAGFRDPALIAAEPGSVFTRPIGTELTHKAKLGAMQNWDFALRWLLANTKTAFVAVLQDDIEFKLRAAGALAAALDRPLPADFGFFSLYSPRCHRDFITSYGWNFGTVGWHMVGAQALVFSRESATALVNHPRYKEHVAHYTANEQIDCIVGLVMSALMRRACFWYKPSLCRHIGAHLSTLRHTNQVHGSAIEFYGSSTLSEFKLSRLIPDTGIKTFNR